MAFELPPLPFPKEPGTNNPYIATPDEGGGYTVPSGHYFKKKVGDLHLWVPVSESDPLPTKSTNADAALSALRDSLLGSGNKTLSDLATALEPLATNEKQVELVSALGAIADAAVSDPAAAGAVIALLKGVLSRLQAVEGKIDGITDGTAPAKTELTGSIATTITEGNLAVRAAELEAKIEEVRVLLNTLAGEDFATQTTLAQILAKMIAAPATEAKQDSLATLVGAIEDKLDEGELAVRAAELETAISNLQTALLGSQSTAAKQDALAGLIGALDAVAVSDPAAAGAVIALLKGLLSRLQTLENKIDSFTTGEETVNTELKGSKIRLVRNLQTLNDPIEPEQSENISIYATAGHIATLNILSFSVGNPDDATTGLHRLYASIGSSLSVERFLEFSNVYNTNVLFNTYGGYEGSTSEERISVARQAINAGAIKFNDEIPLRIDYRNSTDAVQTKTRYLLTVVTEEAYI
jgi:hypothetical protein